MPAPEGRILHAWGEYYTPPVLVTGTRPDRVGGGGGKPAMQFSIRGKNIEVTGALKQYVEKRVGKIEKYFGLPLAAQVTLSVQKDRHIVEVTVPLDSVLLRGEEETDDMYSSIDLVVEKLERQIEKYKTRINRKLQVVKTKTGQAGAGEADEEEPQVVKVKRFPIKPMAVDEAVMQMNLIGHDFFVFTNAETEQVNVVYRRRDGNYGLIEPDR